VVLHAGSAISIECRRESGRTKSSRTASGKHGGMKASAVKEISSRLLAVRRGIRSSEVGSALLDRCALLRSIRNVASSIWFVSVDLRPCSHSSHSQSFQNLRGNLKHLARMSSVDGDVGIKIVCVLQWPELGEQAREIVLVGLERLCGDDVVLNADWTSHS
jgi:hypothetical protein